MQIKGINNLTVHEIQDEVGAGGKFVIYSYCVSIIFMTFKRGTDIYFIRHTENRLVKGLPWFFISLFLGWWGFPWGLIYTPSALYTDIRGGKDVTDEVMGFIHSQTGGPVFDFEKEVTAEEEKQLEALKGDLEKK
jgi:hypothetical protein